MYRLLGMDLTRFCHISHFGIRPMMCQGTNLRQPFCFPLYVVTYGSTSNKVGDTEYGRILQKQRSGCWRNKEFSEARQEKEKHKKDGATFWKTVSKKLRSSPGAQNGFKIPSYKIYHWGKPAVSNSSFWFLGIEFPTRVPFQHRNPGFYWTKASPSSLIAFPAAATVISYLFEEKSNNIMSTSKEEQGFFLQSSNRVM